MRRILLRGAGLLFLALTCLHLALPSNLAASSAKIIYSFAGGADGAFPYSDLIADAAGNLYGTTYGGGGACDCGTVFELIRTKDGWKHQVLYSFAGGTNDGAVPAAGLVFDIAGNLYGTTLIGGIFNCIGDCGTVFELTPNRHGGWSEKVLYFFSDYNDGMNPESDLVFDSQGNLYGTAGGGTSGGHCGWSIYWSCGMVFKLTPNLDGTWTKTTIHNFAGAPDAAFPLGPLVLDSDGSFYGATEYGGTGQCVLPPDKGPPYGCGALYHLTPAGDGWTETVIYSFFRGRGFARNPSGGLVIDNSGRLLAASVYGGDGDGAFFLLEETKKGWEQTALYRFYGNPDGINPMGRLAMSPQGNLFGATQAGGRTRLGPFSSLRVASTVGKNACYSASTALFIILQQDR
jgi:uncharacterized repeat protein (TIGR03803 family)